MEQTQTHQEPMSGEYSNGEELTVKEYKRLIKYYPQGWRYYAGDTCKHGVYVGGCGIDWMCGRCEMEE